jgi:hypothetical protein
MFARACVLVGIVVGWSSAWAEDTATVDGEAFDWASVLTIPPERRDAGNAWERWSAAGTSISGVSEAEHDLLVDASTNRGIADEDIDAVRELVGRLESAAAAFRLEPGEYVQMPRPRGIAGLADVSSVRSLTRVRSASIELAWLDGRRDEAIVGFDEVFACIDAAMQDNGSIVGLLNTVVATNIGLARARWLMDQPEVDEMQLDRVDRVLARGEELPLEGLRHALAAEYRNVFRAVLEGLPETRDIDSMLRWVAAMGLEVPRDDGREPVFGEGLAELLDVPATRELYGRPLAEHVRGIGGKWVPDGWKRTFGPMEDRWDAELGSTGLRLLQYDGRAESPEVVAEVRSDLARVVNPIGKILVAMMAPPFDSLNGSAYSVTTARRALRVYGAMRVLQLRGEVLPEELESLIGVGVIDDRSKLIDPMSGRLFGYDRERRILWSVGRDGVDDGGIGDETNVGGSRDLVWVLPEID